jgi:hypothetical protein
LLLSKKRRQQKKWAKYGMEISMKIYYMKSIAPHWLTLTEASESPFVSISRNSFRKNYRKLPITLLMNDVERAFNILNSDGNPMSSEENQRWLSANGVRHTSMSAGDIALVNGKYYIILGVGHAEIQWVR